MSTILRCERITKKYTVGSNEVKALDDASFEVEKGKFVVILGPSGAGKSTLLNVIGGMDVPTSGKLYVSERNIARYNKKELSLYRRNKIGFVFQFYNLMPNLTALENVELATELKKDSLSSKLMLEQVGLGSR